jgi:hypothetical protein
MEYPYTSYGPLPTHPPALTWNYVVYPPQATYAIDYRPYTSYVQGMSYASYAPPPPPAATNRVDPTAAYDTIGWVLQELRIRTREFEFPNRLDFCEPPNDSQIPRLSQSRRNQPLRDHRASLEYLLDVLAGVRSYGDDGVKEARTDAVERVKSELAGLKQKKAALWHNVSRCFCLKKGKINLNRLRDTAAPT